MVTIGQLKQRLLLEQAVCLGNGQGTQWQELIEILGMIEPIRVRGQYIRNNKIPEITHEITIRYNKQVRHNMRFYCNGTFFKISAVFCRDPNKQWLTCLCISNNDYLP